ncbi:glycosyl hydrolase family 85-domain-containing protein [Cladochytrium replicatum]|nr:glycosyl hydrolase family 85-domain-containing protein [Cladochytrium replicatum]
MPDDPKVPRSVPLSSVQAIADWCPGSDPFNVSTVPLRRRPSLNALHSTRHEDKMEMLACHDNGGAVYKEDALIQGNNDGKQIYTLRYFHHVDIFIYFSHARLTIPPAAWTNASHRNGVKMIGTYISEWDDGRPDTLKLLYGKDFDPTKPGFSDNERFEGQFNPYFANKLVEIAEYFKFDGWFFNIEHDFKTSVDASNMLWFLRYITDKMHERIPNSLVLWYDSVTVSGDLRWQNRVSDHNLPFLLVTDGIFLNYGWAEEYPQASVTLARRAIDGVQLNPTTRRIMSVQNALSWHDAREAVRRDIMERQKREVPPEVIERERPKLGESEVEKREREQRIRERLWREFVAREAEVEHVVGEGSWFTETNEPRSGPVSDFLRVTALL